jgi:hypothetical protein
MTDAPLQHLHAAHRRTDHRDHVLDAEFFLHQTVLRLHHVADLKLRKLHARLRFGIARRSREAVRDRIGANDEILFGVERLAGADHEVDAMMVAAHSRHHQDRVGSAGVERAVRDIGNREVLDRLAALQCEIAFAVELMRRLLRRMRRGG